MLGFSSLEVCNSASNITREENMLNISKTIAKKAKNCSLKSVKIDRKTCTQTILKMIIQDLLLLII